MNDILSITIFNDDGVAKMAFVDNRPPKINFAEWICTTVANLDFKQLGKIVQVEMMYCVNEQTRVVAILEITTGGITRAVNAVVKQHPKNDLLVIGEWFSDGK